MGRWYRLPASQTGAVDSLARFGGIACSLRVRQAVIPNLRKLTAVPATQRVRGIPSEVPLDEDDGMPAACVLNFDSMIVLPKSWFVEPICQLSPIRMVQVRRALSVAMGC